VGEESSSARVVGFVGIQQVGPVWSDDVEFGVFEEGPVSGLAMAVDVFPGLGAAVD
jgi:hypothetical protein